MDYKQNLHNRQTSDLRELLTHMPTFLVEFFRGLGESKSASTKLNYAYDLRGFIEYLLTETELGHSKTLSKLLAEDEIQLHKLKFFTLQDLEKVTVDYIEAYLDYVSVYETNKTTKKTIVRTNQAQGKARKLAAIRALYTYFVKKGKLQTNPAHIVASPKIKEKAITYLEVDEAAKLLDMVEGGENLTKKQQAFHEKTRERDLALCTLLLGTGLRVSECVGINLQHIDFETRAIIIARKGGNQEVIYFGDEVDEALQTYLVKRKDMVALEGHESALFLSLQNRRITERAVQNLVKKYAKNVTLKNISPHKLRSTYGTHLYRETGDIYLVAAALGHKDVNTTKTHYASLDDDRRRAAAQVVKLRKE